MSDQTAPFMPGSETSRAAAKAIADQLPRQRERLIAYAERAGIFGFCVGDLVADGMFVQNAAWPRVRELSLEEPPLIVKVGRIKAPSGHKQDWWMLTEDAEAQGLQPLELNARRRTITHCPHCLEAVT